VDPFFSFGILKFSMKTGNEKEKKGSTMGEVVTREYTINLHKRLHGIGFKKRAPRAIKAIKEFASKMMGTDDNRVDAGLNKFVWSKGIRNVPYRVRVRIARKRNEDEESSEKLYTHITHVNVSGYKGLKTEVVKDEE
jgi:large subunit ribosomal protein L31e